MKRTYLGKQATQIVRHVTEIGQSIEEMIRQSIETKAPIEATAPMIYTEKAKGVQPEHDIRTDRQELALDATDKFSKSMRAKTDEKPQGETGEQTIGGGTEKPTE